MRKTGIAALLALALAACGQGGGDKAADTGGAPPVGQSVGADGGGDSGAAATGAVPQGGAAIAPNLAGRTGELVNPSELQMLLLYYSVAGLPAPIEQWADEKVQYEPAHERAAKRTQAAAEFQQAAQSVANIGRLRLTIGTTLSDYDPSYHEFRVGAFSPSSMVSFRAQNQVVNVKFANGQYAQIWSVPQADSQGVLDRMGASRSVNADALLQIAGAQAEQRGGTIVVNVLEYELTSTSYPNVGTIVGRVRIGGQ